MLPAITYAPKKSISARVLEATFDFDLTRNSVRTLSITSTMVHQRTVIASRGSSNYKAARMPPLRDHLTRIPQFPS